MAHYLVTAQPNVDLLAKLRTELEHGSFIDLQPFGSVLTQSLCDARLQPDGRATWEEEDYCYPPLAEERVAVLDRYFHELEVHAVPAGFGWATIESLPRLFPDLRRGDGIEAGESSAFSD
jgi:hypothetical protein